jgi:signal transduction histidine kinase
VIIQEHLMDQCRLLVTHWPDPMLIIDNSGRVIAQSVQARDILGWELGDYGTQLAHQKLCSQARHAQHGIDNCLFTADQSNSDWESHYWCTREGRFISVDVKRTPLLGELKGLSAWSFIDNGERAHNRAEFEKFALFVQLSPAPIAEFDCFGQMLFANNALQKLLLNSGVNESGTSRVLPAELESICGQYCERQSKQKSLSELRSSYTVAFDGLFVEWHFLDLFRDNLPPEEQSIIGFAFDVTEQVSARNALERAQLDARRDFYAKMVHELRTPLNAILGFSELLLKRSRAKLSEREIKNLVAINSAGFQLNELVTDTLDISKIEAGYMTLEISQFSFEELWVGFQAQIESLANAKNLSLVCDLEPDLALYSDRNKVRQILLNLLSNAVKYTHSGTITLTAKRQKDTLIVSVKDTGIGIPESQLDKLFRDYHRLGDSQNTSIMGTGLGLALVHELIAMLDGTIAVTSQYQRGSCFSVCLPLRAQKPVEAFRSCP